MNVQIIGLAGREPLQRNFATLPERAEHYANRKVTLNERFSIIERGYYLHRETPKDPPLAVNVIPSENRPTHEELVNMLRAADAKRQERLEKGLLTDSQNTTPARTTPRESMSP